MNIIVVEDESRVLSFLVEALKADGHSVQPIATYEAALEVLQGVQQSVDLFIFDRLLNRVDALDLVPIAKKNFPLAKVLILSTIDSPAQKAAALDLGADDYLQKPFSLLELSARVRSLGRRAAGTQGSTHIYTVRDLQLNAVEHKVSVNGRPVDLSNKEYLVLLALIEHPGRVLNKFQLLDRVWNMQFDVESNVVEVTIKNLRKKLAEAASKTEVLSRRNIGYWIEA